MNRLDQAPEPIARFRVLAVARPEASIEFSLTEPLFVLDGKFLQANQLPQQPGITNPEESPGQIVLARNPDAWRLKILSGPPAEKDGIASYDWLLDSQLILDWAGYRLQFVENGTFETGSKPDDRSGLFRLASTLAAGNLQLEEERKQLDQLKSRLVAQKTSLASALKKRWFRLKKTASRIRKSSRKVARDKADLEESKKNLESHRAALAGRQKELDRSMDRLVALRARAVARWRSHVEASLLAIHKAYQSAEQKAQASDALHGQLLPLMERLTREQERLHQVEKRLDEEKNQWREALDAWKREEMARQGQWLQRQAELTQRENQIRVEGMHLVQLRDQVQKLLHDGRVPEPQDWERVFQEKLSQEQNFNDRLTALDSWTKRLETWAGALGEREIQCAKREQELASIVSEYQELRYRREAELDRQAQELNQKEIAFLEKAKQAGTSELATATKPLLLAAPKPRTRKPRRPKLRPPLRLGPRAKELAGREAQVAEREAQVSAMEMRTLALGRKLAEEALVLEKYRARLLEDRESHKDARREMNLMRKQWRARTAAQRQNLESLRDYLVRLGVKIRRWAKNLALREANIVEAELRLLEERSHQAVASDIQLLNAPSPSKAA